MIRITFPNYKVFEISESDITRIKAQIAYYYANRAGLTDEQIYDNFQNEIKHINELQVLDWIKNNMDWKDLEEYVKEVADTTPPLEELFGDAEIEIV